MFLKCIDASGWAKGDFTEGKIYYTEEKVRDDKCIHIINDHGDQRGPYIHRFVEVFPFKYYSKLCDVEIVVEK